MDTSTLTILLIVLLTPILAFVATRFAIGYRWDSRTLIVERRAFAPVIPKQPTGSRTSVAQRARAATLDSVPVVWIWEGNREEDSLRLALAMPLWWLQRGIVAVLVGVGSVFLPISISVAWVVVAVGAGCIIGAGMGVMYYALIRSFGSPFISAHAGVVVGTIISTALCVTRFVALLL